VKLERYILRQLAVALAFSVGGILFVALPGIAVGAIHRLPSASAGYLLRYLSLSTQNLVPYVLPICFLLATVATYGRLAADREWVAVQMAGVRPGRMLVPALAVGVVLAVFTLWLLSMVLPHGKVRARTLVIEATSSALSNLGPGRTSLSHGDVILEALWHDPETGDLHEVFIREEREGPASRRDLHAKRAHVTVEGSVLHARLYDLYIVEPGAQTSQTYSEEVELIRPLPDPWKPSYRPRYLSSLEMYRQLEEGEVQERYVLPYRFELHYRAALSTAFLLFALLGAATGLILRRGTQLGALAVSSGYSLIYYLLQMQLAKDLGTDGTLHPALAAWFPVGVGAVVAVPLLRRALRR